MHCSDEALIDNNDLEAQMHIKDCMRCQQRLWQLKQLKSEAEKLPIYQPNELAWLKVKQSLPLKKKNRFFNFPIAIAASFVVGIVVTLVANNTWQEHNIEQLIAESSSFERQLVSQQLIGTMVDKSLWEISQIDEKLNLQQSKSSQQQLWKKRNELLKLMLKTKTSRKII